MPIPGRIRLSQRGNRLVTHLRQQDLSASDKAVVLARSLLRVSRLSRMVLVGRHVFFCLNAPPKVFRGLRDVVVRRAHAEDLEALCSVETSDPALLRSRFDRGDPCYVGLVGHKLICHVWFHRGPSPFHEDDRLMASWGLAPDTFWSYAAATSPESRSSGIFVKVFQEALGELFHEQRAAQVLCLVRHDNVGSLLLHERLGFCRLGTLTSMGLIGRGPRILIWRGTASGRRRLFARFGVKPLEVPMPPAERGHTR